MARIIVPASVTRVCDSCNCNMSHTGLSLSGMQIGADPSESAATVELDLCCDCACKFAQFKSGLCSSGSAPT